LLQAVHRGSEFEVGDVTLNPTDLDRAVEASPGASQFTVLFSWANPGTNGTQGVT